ncbi:MAG TPA: PAS domain-containing protein [Planctomycetota bacterium]|nr:PAS domain-containing protein [Planctomycetota bacterium]
MTASNAPASVPDDLFAHGGEMGALMRAVDWAATPVGPVDRWPQSLRTTVRTLLECRLPMYLAWGREHIQFYNDAYRPILGDKHPALGRAARQTWDEIWPTIGPMWQEVWAGKPIGFDDFRLTIRRFGYDEDCWFNFSYSPVRDERGEVAGVLVTFAETTQRVQSERRLTEERERLRSIFMQAPASIAIFRGPDHVYEFANPPYLAMLGRASLVGQAVRDALPEIRDSGIYEILDRVYRTGEPFVTAEYEVPIRMRPDAEPQPCWFSFSLHPLRDELGAIFGQIVVAIDVSAQVHARRRLEALTRDLTAQRDMLLASERRYRDLADSMPQIVWTAGPDGRVDYLNDRWHAYTGLARDADRATAWNAVVHPDDLPAVVAAWERSVASGDAHEIRCRLRQGSTRADRWHLVRALAVRDPAGAITRWHGTATDIHDHQSAEAELRAARSRLDLVTGATDLGVWYCDLPFDELVWNRQVKSHFWLEPDERVTIDLFYARLHPDDREPTRAAIDRSIAGKTPYDVQYRTVNPGDGRIKWIRAIGRGFFGPDGAATSFDGITIDVTATRAREDRERLLSEAARRLSATLDAGETLQAIADAAVPALADAIVIDLVDEDGLLDRALVADPDPARRALAEQLHDRYPPARDDVVWRTIDGVEPLIVADADDATWRGIARDDAHLALLRGLGISAFAVLPLVAQGSAIGALSLITRGGRRLGDDQVAAARDLASRAAASLANVRSFARAERSRRRAETLREVGLTVAGELDLQRVVQAITDAGLALTRAGFGAFFYNVIDEKGGRYTLYTIAGVPREAFSRFPMPRATALFGPTFRGEGVIRLGDVRKDPRFGTNAPYNGMPAGHLPVVSYLAVPVRSRSGEILGGLFYGHDQADRFGADAESVVVGLAAQAAVAIDNARLFDAANAKTRELARANDELQQFAYISSHDLQEPLRTVTQYLDLLDTRYRASLDDRARRFIAAAMGSATRMQTLLDDLLGYSRVGSAGTALADVPLGPLVDDVLRDLDAAIQAQGARVVVRPLPTVVADETKLRLLLQNLIGNALKFRGDAAPVVEVSAVDDAAGTVVSVADNGIGIAPEHHERIFDVFQRLHHANAFAGSGIGLAVCKRVVQQHGGRIWVESDGTGGATFRFTLPRPTGSRA